MRWIIERASRWMVVPLFLGLTLGLAIADGTAHEKFLSAIEKVAPPFETSLSGGKIKAICVCFSGTLNMRYGVVESTDATTQINATCTVPTFRTDGSILQEFACPGDWTIVSKP
jgi:hypothetical protein